MDSDFADPLFLNQHSGPLSDQSVDDLIRSLNQGDLKAAEQLFVHFEPYLRMVVRRKIHPRLRSKFDSVDIVQSVWADLLLNLQQSGRKFEDKNHLRNFLNRVVVNRVHDRYRQHQREVTHQKSMGEMELSEIPAINQERPSQVMQHDELWQQMLQACPEKHRDILRFRRDGLRHSEIAERTGLHPSSVRRILYDLAKILNTQNLIDNNQPTKQELNP